MTAKEQVDSIRDLLFNNLPDLLQAENMLWFDDYLSRAPTDAEKRQIGVYIHTDDNNTDARTLGVIIQAQIVGEAKTLEYHSIIKPFLEANLLGSVVGMTQRLSIESDLWPMDINKSVGFILYSVIFQTELDDCED